MQHKSGSIWQFFWNLFVSKLTLNSNLVACAFKRAHFEILWTNVQPAYLWGLSLSWQAWPFHYLTFRVLLRQSFRFLEALHLRVSEIRPPKDQQVFTNTSRTVNRKQAFFSLWVLQRMGISFSHLGIYYFPQLSVKVPHTFQSHHFNHLIEDALDMFALGFT